MTPEEEIRAINKHFDDQQHALIVQSLYRMSNDKTFTWKQRVEYRRRAHKLEQEG